MKDSLVLGLWQVNGMRNKIYDELLLQDKEEKWNFQVEEVYDKNE